MNIVQVTYQHPDASMPLLVPVLVVPNTPEEVGNDNIIKNSALDLKWLKALKPHGGVAILCGGGPSIKNCTHEIEVLRNMGGTVFGLNGASKWLNSQKIDVDYQVILDAKQETSELVDPKAHDYLFASQCHPDTVNKATPTLFHMNNLGIEDFFPEERVNRGGYVLIGGGVSVGITSMVLAYAMGFREFHLFGYDSSNDKNDTHAYPQTMNQFIPIIDVEWGDKTYSASMPMKIQAEAFPKFAMELQREGCVLNVYGEGLLQAMWKEHPTTEQQKYRKMWSIDLYRGTAPGEDIAEKFIEIVNPKGTVVDFGCGTGRGAKVISDKTDCNVILVDFADNCRDHDVVHLPFIEWDLTKPIPVNSDYGFCTDVMEHIPTKDVETVINNILNSSKNVFFQISTVDDVMGSLIDCPLHLTVKPHSWWKNLFISLGYGVKWEEEQSNASLFYITRGDL